MPIREIVAKVGRFGEPCLASADRWHTPTLGEKRSSASIPVFLLQDEDLLLGAAMYRLCNVNCSFYFFLYFGDTWRRFQTSH